MYNNIIIEMEEPPRAAFTKPQEVHPMKRMISALAALILMMSLAILPAAAGSIRACRGRIILDPGRADGI